ncbi:HNH endonuclease signature motif containing protein [Brevibacterium renqingii]|uniref:HNH endonuclease signature motif containing protein n=1 Tax=Brevibacterium renqingii TaxID=2776916 RepID=UPI0020A50EF1|nr:HNH endonuclease signature motif containing protein [Brevibacterium renqingii]
MKNIGNADDATSNLHSASRDAASASSPSQYRRAHGRRLEIAEENDLVDLLRVYADSSLAQIKSLIASSEIVVQDVAYVRGLKKGAPDRNYAFASFTETVARYRNPEPVTSGASAGSPDSPVLRPDAEARAWEDALAQTEAESRTTSRRRGRGRKKDRAAGRRVRRARKQVQELLDNPPPLPDFPGYDPKLTFFTWLRGNIETTEVGVYSSLLGATTSNSLKHLTASVTLAHGLPKFLRRCLDGDFTIEHVDYVTRRCRDLRFEHLPVIDDFLDNRRADITIETFKRSVALKLAATQPPEGSLENVAFRRRVDISTGDDGTAYLTLTGPAPELQACYKRIEAFARSVCKSNTGAFSDQLKAGDCFDDDRTISALMFDILTRTRPQLKLRIISTGDTDSEPTSTEFPLDGLFAGPDGVPMHHGESLLDYIERVFDEMDRSRYAPDSTLESPGPEMDPTQAEPETAESMSGTAGDRTFESQILEALLSSRTSTGRVAGSDMHNAFSSLVGTRAAGARPRTAGADETVVGATDAFGTPIRSEGGGRISYELLLDMPTNEYWLSNQARTFITVPMLTLLSQYLSEADGEEAQLSAGPPGTDGRRTACHCGRCICGRAGDPPHGSDPPYEPDPPACESDGPPRGRTVPPPPTTKNLTSQEVCDLAGTLPDGSPIPADMARRVAGYASTWTRLLTDPATGTPVDAKALSYTIPESIRKTLIAQYVSCTFPGCTLPAETAEVDHIDPFDHDEPSRGGLTRFGNLHCLCKQHHQAKTDGKFDVRMTAPGHLEYVFRRGVAVEVEAPDNPLNVEHARLFLERFGSALPRPNRAPAPSPDPAAKAEPPSPGARRKARECPEPAAAHGQPGWKEAVPGFANGFGDTAPACDDSAELRDWFWDSGEPPPF